MSAVAMNRCTKILATLVIVFFFGAAMCTAAGETLSKIKLAPQFTLTTEDGKRLTLKELRGKVLAIMFIFASCTDTCPLLTAEMAGIQNRLGHARSSGIFSFNYCGSGA